MNDTNMSSEEVYKQWVKEQLKIVNCKVHTWKDWSEEGSYEAFIDSRRVVIPTPKDDWSFLVALHEIGHVSTGHRLYTYLMEYNAEKWAIKRAKDAYGIVCPEYEEDAKNYVRAKLIGDLKFSELSVDKVKSYVLDWLGETPQSMSQLVSEAKFIEEPVAFLNKSPYIYF